MSRPLWTTRQREDDGPNSDWIEIEIAMGSAIVLPVGQGAARHWALLDTGAAVSAIDARLADRLRLPTVGHVELQSDTTFAQGGLVARPPLRIGPAWLQASSLAVLDLGALRQTVGRPISFILGQDAFGAARLDLDLPRLRLGLLASGSRAPAGAIPLHRSRLGRRSIDVRIEGAPPTKAVIDLGSSNAIMMSQVFAAEHGLTRGRPTSSAATATVGGIAISTTCRIDDLDIGGVHLQGAPAEMFDEWVDETVPLNIGLPILRRFRMIVDFHADSVWLQPGADVGRPFDYDRAGLGLAYDGDSLRVVHIARRGPAENAGWRIGERIVAVDGIPIDGGYPASEMALWRQKPAGTTAVLTMADRDRRRLTLRDYL